jgi:hypothetical protein
MIKKREEELRKALKFQHELIAEKEQRELQVSEIQRRLDMLNELIHKLIMEGK